MDGAREIWKFSVVIEASEADRQRVAETIARALCPDDDHAGPCEVPWVLISSHFEDLDDEERAAWQEDFEEDRRRGAPLPTDGPV